MRPDPSRRELRRSPGGAGGAVTGGWELTSHEILPENQQTRIAKRGRNSAVPPPIEKAPGAGQTGLGTLPLASSALTSSRARWIVSSIPLASSTVRVFSPQSGST